MNEISDGVDNLKRVDKHKETFKTVHLANVNVTMNFGVNSFEINKKRFLLSVFLKLSVIGKDKAAPGTIYKHRNAQVPLEKRTSFQSPILARVSSVVIDVCCFDAS